MSVRRPPSLKRPTVMPWDAAMTVMPLDMAKAAGALARATALLLDREIKIAVGESVYAVSEEKNLLFAYTLLFAAVRPLLGSATVSLEERGELVRLSLSGDLRAPRAPTETAMLFEEARLPYDRFLHALSVAKASCSLETENGVFRAHLDLMRFRAERFVVCASSDEQTVCTEMYLVLLSL